MPYLICYFCRMVSDIYAECYLHFVLSVMFAECCDCRVSVACQYFNWYLFLSVSLAG
jgi:hypothetical protein